MLITSLPHLRQVVLTESEVEISNYGGLHTTNIPQSLIEQTTDEPQGLISQSRISTWFRCIRSEREPSASELNERESRAECIQLVMQNFIDLHGCRYTHFGFKAPEGPLPETTKEYVKILLTQVPQDLWEALETSSSLVKVTTSQPVEGIRQGAEAPAVQEVEAPVMQEAEESAVQGGEVEEGAVQRAEEPAPQQDVEIPVVQEVVEEAVVQEIGEAPVLREEEPAHQQEAEAPVVQNIETPAVQRAERTARKQRDPLKKQIMRFNREINGW